MVTKKMLPAATSNRFALAHALESPRLASEDCRPVSRSPWPFNFWAAPRCARRLDTDARSRLDLSLLFSSSSTSEGCLWSVAAILSRTPETAPPLPPCGPSRNWRLDFRQRVQSRKLGRGRNFLFFDHVLLSAPRISPSSPARFRTAGSQPQLEVPHWRAGHGGRASGSQPRHED